MTNYKKLYFTLFNRITDAIEALDKVKLTEMDMYNSMIKAKTILIKAQQDTEEMYINSEDDGDF